jgi:hypothetical protein
MKERVRGHRQAALTSYMTFLQSESVVLTANLWLCSSGGTSLGKKEAAHTDYQNAQL